MSASAAFLYVTILALAALVSLLFVRRKELRARGFWRSLRSPAIFCLALSALITFPVIFRMGSSLLGDREGDVWKHLWGFWWVRESIASGHAFPLFTDLLRYPKGGPLLFIDPLGALHSSFAQSALGFLSPESALVISYNLVVLFNIFLSALGAYLLALYLAKDRRAAYVSAIIYGASPHLISRIVSGVSESFNGAYIPFFLLFLMKSLYEKSFINPAAAGLLLYFCFLGTPYNGVFALIAAMILVPPVLLRLRRKVSPARLLARLIVFFVAFLVPFNAMFNVYFGASTAQGRLAPVFCAPGTEDLGRMIIDLPRENKAVCTVLDYFRPGKKSLTVLQCWDRLSLTGYPGLIPLALGTACLIIARRRYVIALAAMGLVFAGLSLGPYIHLTESFRLGVTSPLYMAFYHGMPYFKMCNSPERFSLMVSLCLALLAPYALGSVGKIAKRFKPLVVPAAAFLILIELLVFSPAPWPIPLSDVERAPVFEEWGSERDRFAIVNVPALRDSKRSLPGEYFFDQTIHKKPMLTEINPSDNVFFCDYPLISWIFIRQNNFISRGFRMDQPVLDEEAVRNSVMKLKADNYRFVVLHKRLVPPGLLEEFTALLEQAFGAPRKCAPDKIIYTVR